MRDFKFRAWDKENKEMHYDVGILGDAIYVDFSGNKEYEEVSGHELMQYTGLKDTNGTEICEGDLYKIYGNVHVVRYAPSRGGVVPFAAGDGCGCCESDNVVRYHFDGNVIGNIYENPNLLEGE